MNLSTARSADSSVSVQDRASSLNFAKGNIMKSPALRKRRKPRLQESASISNLYSGTPTCFWSACFLVFGRFCLAVFIVSVTGICLAVYVPPDVSKAIIWLFLHCVRLFIVKPREHMSCFSPEIADLCPIRRALSYRSLTKGRRANIITHAENYIAGEEYEREI